MSLLLLMVISCSPPYVYTPDLQEITFELDPQLDQGLLNTTKTVVEAHLSDLLTDFYDHTQMELSASLFKVSLLETGNCGQGAFCTPDIPLEFRVDCFNDLSTFEQFQLVVHEFGHSYYNYVHPDARAEYSNGPEYDPNEPLEIMDATDYFSEEHYQEFLLAYQRFFSGQNQWAYDSCSNPTAKRSATNNVYCNKYPR